jgi:uncharacterized membrane protein YkoI
MMTMRKLLIIALAGASLGLTTLGLTTAPSQADEATACLSRDQRREVIAAGQVVSLATAIRTSRRKATGEVVKARLCQSPKGLVYLLTVLARDGKVARLTIDAQNGKIVSGL